MVKNIFLMWIIIFCLIWQIPAGYTADNTITIGTFNIQNLGETKNATRIKNLADICRGMHLLAVQEVAEEGTGLEDLAEAMGSEYNFSVSDVTTHERFGIIWKEPVIQVKPCEFAKGLNLGRDPYMGYFKAGNFDFQILVFHLFWEGSKKTYPHTRGAEIRLLDEWLCHRTDPELDLILIGDFNEPNMYYSHNYPPPLSFHEMFHRLLKRHNFVSVTLEKRIPTSIVNQNIYDHIIINPAHYLCEEFAGMTGVEVIQWEQKYDADNNGNLDWTEYNTAREAVTDHRLVLAKFRIDLEDDD